MREAQRLFEYRSRQRTIIILFEYAKRKEFERQCTRKIK
jgi:hypothetical protein